MSASGRGNGEAARAVSALQGVVVLECGDSPAAAFCGHLLHQLGARVTKFVASSPATADVAEPAALRRRAQRLYFDAGKTTIDAPLHSNLFSEALRQSHVVVRGLEQTSGAATAQLRSEYASWGAQRLGLVYAALTPFGVSGPMSGWAGGDLNAQALSGWSAITGNPDEPPLGVAYDSCAMQHGLGAAGAIVAALLAPDVASRSELVDVSEVAVLAADIRMYSASYSGYGIPMVRSGHRAPGSTGRYPHTVLPCQDGLVALICRSDVEWDRLIAMMGNPPWALEDRYRDFFAMGTRYPDEVDQLLIAWLRRHTKAELGRLATEYRVPLAPVRTAAEALDDVQMNHRGFFTTAEESVALPGFPAHWSTSDGQGEIQLELDGGQPTEGNRS
jgi:CoA:oxalate CoA-transferase